MTEVYRSEHTLLVEYCHKVNYTVEITLVTYNIRTGYIIWHYLNNNFNEKKGLSWLKELFEECELAKEVWQLLWKYSIYLFPT